MRVWDFQVEQLCDKHLVAEHREVHVIWAILTGDKKGWRKHPEVKRWEGHLPALRNRHTAQVTEFGKRGLYHFSPIPDTILVDGSSEWPKGWETLAAQAKNLKGKKCKCQIDR